VFVSERLCWSVGVQLREWADAQGVHYQTAWKWFWDGKLPVPVVQTESGVILVQSESARDVAEGLGLYALVSAHDTLCVNPYS
jgi:putative resolvase